MTLEEKILKELIMEILLQEQLRFALGGVSATGGLPLTKKPKIFDPERPKRKNRRIKNKEN